MFGEVTESDIIQHLKFHKLVPGYSKSLCHNWEGGKKHNALQKILTGVTLSTAGAAVHISVTFPAVLFYWLKAEPGYVVRYEDYG